MSDKHYFLWLGIAAALLVTVWYITSFRRERRWWIFNTGWWLVSMTGAVALVLIGLGLSWDWIVGTAVGILVIGSVLIRLPVRTQEEAWY
jgi:hypothetical protein